jgi:hypothetical protein
MTDIREMLRMMAQEEDRPQQTILPEAAIERMKEVAARIKVGNPFKEGDIVTARSDGGLKSPRAPMLVIETCEGTFPKGDTRKWGLAVCYRFRCEAPALQQWEHHPLNCSALDAGAIRDLISRMVLRA